MTSCYMCFFFFKPKTAYEMRISDWSSDVCSSDLRRMRGTGTRGGEKGVCRKAAADQWVVVCAGVAQLPLPIEDYAVEDWEREIGRGSCRDRLCQEVEIAVVAVSLIKKLQLL